MSSAPNDAQKKLIQAKFKRLFEQMQNGCGNPICTNDLCASNPSYKYTSVPKGDLVKVALAHVGKGKICSVYPPPSSSSSSASNAMEEEKTNVPNPAPSSSSSSSSSQGFSVSSLVPSTPASSSNTAPDATPNVRSGLSFSHVPSTPSTPAQPMFRAPAATPSAFATPAPSSSSSSSSSAQASSSSSSMDVESPVSQVRKSPKPVEGITLQTILELLQEGAESDDYRKLIRYVGSSFADIEVLNASFRLPLSEARVYVKGGENQSRDAMDVEGENPLSTPGGVEFKSIETNQKRERESDYNLEPTEEFPLIDFSAVDEVYELLLGDESITGPFMNALHRLEATLPHTRVQTDSPISSLCVFVILLECPLLFDPQYHSILRALLKGILNISPSRQKVLVSWWSRYSPERLTNVVEKLQQFITLQWLQGISSDVFLCARVLELVYNASQKPNYHSLPVVEKANIPPSSPFLSNSIPASSSNLAEMHLSTPDPKGSLSPSSPSSSLRTPSSSGTESKGEIYDDQSIVFEPLEVLNMKDTVLTVDGVKHVRTSGSLSNSFSLSSFFLLSLSCFVIPSLSYSPLLLLLSHSLCSLSLSWSHRCRLSPHQHNSLPNPSPPLCCLPASFLFSSLAIRHFPATTASLTLPSSTMMP